MSCVVCDGNDLATSENPIFVCEDCGIDVHKLCYGITAQSGNIDPWWCSPCGLGHRRAVCQLCLQNGGALKQTTCGHWVHVICALFTDGTIFTNKKRMEPVNISNIPQENHGQNCIFCSEVRGICGKCSAPNCSLFLHITCGQKQKCLKEKTNAKNTKIIFEAYCHQHNPKSSHRLSSVFVVETLAAKDDLSGQKDDDIIEIDSNCSDESFTSGSVVHSATDTSNGSENGVGTGENVTDHFREGDIDANSTINSGNKTESANSSKDNNAIDVSFVHDTYNNSNVTNNGSTICDADESAGAKKEFWWDYLELRKREDELEAQLRSKDEKIDKVKIMIFLLLIKLKLIIKFIRCFA